MEDVWRRSFYDKLHVAPEDHPVLMTERPYNPKVVKERIHEVRNFIRPSTLVKWTYESVMQKRAKRN